MAEALEALLQEGRTFPPPEHVPQGRARHRRVGVRRAERDWQGHWAAQALALDWIEEWHTILEWDLPFAKWFVGGKLNVAYNCLDRHVEAGHGDQVAFHWEGEPGDTRAVTYRELLDESSRVANLLKSLGVAQGRPRRDLHGHGARAAGRAARVRAHRRAAFGRVRRVHRRSRCATASTTPRRRCSSPPTARGGAARSSR